ncbi:AAA family ATPase, partial [Xanthomonas citri pv. citri]
SVARAYERNGYRVVGLATAWTAAQNLQQDADLDEGVAITGWLNSVRKGETSIGKKTLLIVDEAGVVSAQQMRDVLDVAHRAGAKVVLLGDTKQQKSVGAGAALQPIADKLGSHRLDEIRRQHRIEEREAVK